MEASIVYEILMRHVHVINLDEIDWVLQKTLMHLQKNLHYLINQITININSL